jgi:Ca2+-binding RTX toxin-like protein
MRNGRPLDLGGPRRALVAVAAAIVLGLAAAPAGLAGTIAINGTTGELTYTGGSESNNVIVDSAPYTCHPDFGSDPCINIYDSAGLTNVPMTYCRYVYTTTNQWIDCVEHDFLFVVNLGGGNDKFRGWEGDSVVNAGPGSDEVDGAGGDDVISGEGDADQLSGGAGNDTLSGGDGGDELETNAANPPSSTGTDILSGGPGEDKLEYVLRDDGLSITLDGAANDGGGENDNVGSDIETIVGGNGADTMVGDAGPNHLDGENGSDQISGGGGNDYLDGDAGDDRVSGGDGDDEVRGGNGNDSLDGGSGADQFFGDNPCTFYSCYGGSDTVTARDGVVDSVSCGIAADTAIVDHNDVVATDFQQGCETIDRSAAPQPQPPPAPQPQPPPAPPVQPQPPARPRTTPAKPTAKTPTKAKRFAVCHRGRTMRVTKKQLKKHVRHGDKRRPCKPKRR